MSIKIEVLFEEREYEAKKGQLAIQLRVDGKYVAHIWSLPKKDCTYDLNKALVSAVEKGLYVAKKRVMDVL